MHPEKLDDQQLAGILLSLMSILEIDLKIGFLSPCEYNALWDMKVELKEYWDNKHKSN